MEDNVGTSHIISIVFLYTSIGFILLLPISIYRYIKREKFAKVYIEINEKRKGSFLLYLKKTIIIYRNFLWLSPIYLFFVPIALYIFLNVNMIYSLLLMTLMVFLVLVYYLQFTWEINLLTKNQESMSANI